eukprot:SAG22_NODE_6768_length_813_cov_1.474790_1_plen_121_part_10
MAACAANRRGRSADGRTDRRTDGRRTTELREFVVLPSLHDPRGASAALGAAELLLLLLLLPQPAGGEPLVSKLGRGLCDLDVDLLIDRDGVAEPNARVRAERRRRRGRRLRRRRRGRRRRR